MSKIGNFKTVKNATGPEKEDFFDRKNGVEKNCFGNRRYYRRMLGKPENPEIGLLKSGHLIPNHRGRPQQLFSILQFQKKMSKTGPLKTGLTQALT